MLISSVGDQEELTCFERDSWTYAHLSCSVNWNNELYIFGGAEKDASMRRQVSRLSGHKLERVGLLDFDHAHGACSVMANKHLFLCFNRQKETDWKLCRRSTGPLADFTEETSSIFYHPSIRTSCSDSKLQ